MGRQLWPDGFCSKLQAPHSPRCLGLQSGNLSRLVPARAVGRAVDWELFEMSKSVQSQMSAFWNAGHTFHVNDDAKFSGSHEFGTTLQKLQR
jgi:hypothetical protein